MSDQKPCVILCDAREGEFFGIHTLALVDRTKSTALWWTSDDWSIVMVFRHPNSARIQLRRLKYNNPRIVPRDEAFKIIEAQRVQALQQAVTLDAESDHPFDIDPHY